MAKNKFLKLFAFSFCALSIPIFAGCNLVTVNVDKQLKEVALDYDNSRITVTREELINIYRNTNSDSTDAPTKQTVEDALDLAMNREVLVDFLTSDDMAEMRARFDVPKVVLTTYQSNEVWQKVYDYINEVVENIEIDLRSTDHKALPTAEEKEDDDSKAYTPYEKTYEYYGDGVLHKIEKEPDVAYSSKALLTEADKQLSFSEQAQKAYDNFRSKYWHYTDSIALNPHAVNETSYSDKAWTKWINQLLRGESKRNLSKVETEAFLRQVEKVYDVYYQNAVLTAFQSNYEDSLNITAKMVYDKFNELYDDQKVIYDTNISAFYDKMPTSAQDVYYVKEPSAFFKVNHLLVKFTDEQKEAIEQAKTKLDSLEITKAQYDEEVALIKASSKAYNRDTGEYDDINALMANLTASINSASTEAEKLAIFRTYMHCYSEDDATLNAEACYYIPTKPDEVKDSMEEAFAEGSRQLYNNGLGQVGDISSNWVETSYGYHIIMYTGKAEAVNLTANMDETLYNLNAYKLNPLYNKSMLDKVIEQITLTSFSSFQEDVLKALKENKKIVTYPDVYSDLYKN